MRGFSSLFLGLILIGLFFNLGTDQVLAGFGISPPWLKNEHLLPGSYYEQVISLVRGEPKETLLTKVKINAPEIENWITVEPGFEFELPKGVQQFPLKLIVNVPPDAEFKLYQGTIDILTSPKNTEGGQVTTSLGSRAEIFLKVTAEQFSEFVIRLIDLTDVEENSPIKLILKIENKGNQQNGPTKVFLKIFDQYHAALLEESEVDVLEKIDPFQIKDILVEFPTNLKAEQYWGELEIYKNEELIKQDKQVFSILTKTVVAGEELNEGKNEEEKSKKVFYFYIGMGVIAFLILLGIILFLLMKRGERILEREKLERENRKAKSSF